MEGMKITSSTNIDMQIERNNYTQNQKNIADKKEVKVDDNIKFENAFNKAKQYVEINDTRLSLSYDKENKEPIIFVLDKETDEVIRRIPPEKLIEISGDNEKMKGLFFQKDV